MGRPLRVAKKILCDAYSMALLSHFLPSICLMPVCDDDYALGARLTSPTESSTAAAAI